MSAITFMSKVFYPNDHGLSLGMVYRTACRYEYDVTLMSMTSSITAARFLLRPTVALVDRDYQFTSQQQNDDEMSFSMSIYTQTFSKPIYVPLV